MIKLVTNFEEVKKEWANTKPADFLNIDFLNIQSSGSFGADVVRLIRDSTNICIADSVGSYTRGSNAVVRHEVGDNYDYTGESIVNTFLDSPGDTNAHTYKVNLYDHTANNTVWINRDREDSGDSYGYRRTVSTISVMEV